MLKNHLLIALRNARRRPGYAAVNTLGLAVGMACCILVGLYVQDELTFDRFHERSDRLYTVVAEYENGTSSRSTEYSVATVLADGLPDVEQVTRVWNGRLLPVMRADARLQAKQRVVLAEPEFFELFSFPAVAGDAAEALRAPDAAAISQRMAEMYFPDEHPIGQTLTFERFNNSVHTVTVRAVVANPPPNSSLQFDLVAPLALLGEEALREEQWGFSLFETYILTRTPVEASQLSARADAVIARHADIEASYAALPLSDLHLSGLDASGLQGQPRYLYLFGTIAIIVLLIAAVNYVNLVTAQALQRAREVGIRKTLGAGEAQLTRQFLGESILIGLMALGVALALTLLALPAFNRLFDKQLSVFSSETMWIVPVLCGFVLAVAVAAGAYPAFVLARFRPDAALRGRSSAHAGSRMLRGSLVVAQFAISTVLIFGTTVVHRQIDFVHGKNLGFEGDQVLVVDLPRGLDQPETLKSRVQMHQGVLDASIASGVPGLFMMGFTQDLAEAAPQSPRADQRVRFRPSMVDADYLPMFGIPLLAGSNFSASRDPYAEYVINEVAAASLGWTPAEAVGKVFALGPPGTPEGTIVGVTSNFHIASLHDRIDPVVLMRHDPGLPVSLAVRLGAGHMAEGLAHVEDQFEQIAPEASFQYRFLDEIFDEMYRSEERLSRILTAFGGIAIFIACMGLFSLAAFATERRTKEIGIRKVMGASSTRIVGLLSSDFLKLVALALLVGEPLAYLVTRRWLEDFAYRIDVGAPDLAFVGIAVIAIAALAVGYQSVSAALANPADSIRHD